MSTSITGLDLDPEPPFAERLADPRLAAARETYSAALDAAEAAQPHEYATHVAAVSA